MELILTINIPIDKVGIINSPGRNGTIFYYHFIIIYYLLIQWIWQKQSGEIHDNMQIHKEQRIKIHIGKFIPNGHWI